MKKLFKAAHKLAREIKVEYPEVDYKSQFAICLSYLQNNKEEKAVENDFGYQKVANQNGVIYFAVNDLDGLEVAFLTEEKNLYNGKTYKKKHYFTNNYQLGTNKKTNEVKRLYNITINTGDIELKLGKDVKVIKNSRDLSKWGL